VSEIIDHGFIHSLYTFDPNNIPIEFSAAVPDVDLRTHPMMKDRRPSVITSEGAEPQTWAWSEVEHPTPEEERTLYPGEGRILAQGDESDGSK